ncbi:MAG: protein kinase [Gemmatimonadota bacterium]
MLSISPLGDRLRAALAPRILVEREIGSGGTALVFEAHDPSLDRPVAVKVLRPQFATARGSARFLREARILARLGHPNVIAVHEVGEAGGLYYYVMDLLSGDTLRERLRQGPLPEREALAVGLDLLAALKAAHDAGVIHRDIKPENLFLVDDRGVLADFGIAKLEETEEPLTVPDRRVGTPGYMAPEQGLGEAVTPRTDLYAAAALVYEALTGRRWSALDEPGAGDWSNVPARVAHVLQRALARRPDQRWPDAGTFRAALERAGTGRGSRVRLAGIVGAAGLLFLIGSYVVGGGGNGAADRSASPSLAPADLAILPCRTVSPDDSTLGREVARVAYYSLDGVPGLEVAPLRTASRWWDASGGDPTGAAEALRARSVADCRLVRATPDSMELWLDLRRAGGTAAYDDRITGAAQSLELGAQLARSLLRHLQPRERELDHVLEAHDLQAVKAFFRGERAWEVDARKPAETHFENAVRIDPTFTLARWRLADMRRWLASPPGADLAALLRDHVADLPGRDALLLEARVTPPGPRQFERYRRIIQAYPNDAYVTLLYGDELLHRGPLWRVPPDSALHVLELATRKDSFLAPAFDHLFQAQLRRGRAESRATLDRLKAVAADPSAVHIYYPALWEQAYLERFDPPRAAASREILFGGPRGTGLLILAVRYPLALNLPHTELALARMLLSASPSGLAQRTSGHVASGLALMALGRPESALAQFDSAALNEGGEQARLQAAQWRVVPPSLGFPGMPNSQVARGRASLDAIAEDVTKPVSLRSRAAWALALARGTDSESERWIRRARELGEEAGAARLLTFLDALAAGRAGEARAALQRSAPLLAYDSAGRELRPFLQAAVHVRRGEWWESLGEDTRAEEEWAWHEHMDVGGVWHLEVSDEWSTLPRAGEVDWALSTSMRVRRATLLFRLDRAPEACRLLAEVARVWHEAEPGVLNAAEEARARQRRSCPADLTLHGLRGRRKVPS